MRRGLEEIPGNQGVFWNIAPNQSILIVSEWFAIPYMWVSMSVWSELDTQPRIGDMHALCPLLQPFHMGSLAAGYIQEERDWTSRCYFASKPTLHNSNLHTVAEVMPFPLRMSQSHSAVFWLNVLVLWCQHWEGLKWGKASGLLCNDCGAPALELTKVIRDGEGSPFEEWFHFWDQRA